MLTVKQLSTLTGVTARTLHHYDAIGLLRPSRTGANGYRYYDHAAQLRLQQILFYRQLAVPLAEIRRLMESDTFDLLTALRGHQQALRQQAGHLQTLLNTVEQTILHLQGKQTMDSTEIFSGLSQQQEQAYTAEAEQRYNPDTVQRASRQWQSYSRAQQDAIMAEGNTIYTDMVAAIPQGAHSAAAQAIVARWRQHLAYFWIPQPEQLTGLARTYVDDARFKANFDRLDPALAEFMLQAVQHYVSQLAPAP